MRKNQDEVVREVERKLRELRLIKYDSGVSDDNKLVSSSSVKQALEWIKEFLGHTPEITMPLVNVAPGYCDPSGVLFEWESSLGGFEVQFLGDDKMTISIGVAEGEDPREDIEIEISQWRELFESHSLDKIASAPKEHSGSEQSKEYTNA